jgi:hypothetical protein
MSGIHYSLLRTFKGIILVMILATACNETTNLTEETPKEVETTAGPLASVDQVTPVGPAGLSPELEQASGKDKDAKTGIEEVDRVIDIVLSHDLGARRALIRLTTAGCTVALGMGGPPKCVNGLSEGTPVEYLPVLGPGEGEIVLPQNLDRSLDFQAESLYLAYSRTGKPDDDFYYTPGAYVLVFASGDSEGVPFIIVHLNIDGRIIRLDYAVWDPVLLMEREADKVLVAPRLPLQADPSAVTITPTPTPSLLEGTGQILKFEVLSELERPGPGETVDLTWQTQGGSVSICVSYGGWTNSECFDASPSGQQTIILRTEDPVADHWVDFILTVRDDLTSIDRAVRIPVQCHYQWFEDGLSSWCPRSPVEESEAEFQEYESGMTVTQGDISTVLFGEPGAPCRAYLSTPEIDPGFDPPEPPPEHFAPSDGMAALWLGIFPGTEDVRPRLGWPISAPDNYLMKQQCELTPEGQGSCFTSAPDGRVFISPRELVVGDNQGVISNVDETCPWNANGETAQDDSPPITGYGQCPPPFYFAWAYHGLEDLSNEVQAAMDQANIEGAQARAVAYGENVIGYDEETGNSELCSFGAVETDYHITLAVEDLSDLDHLGAVLLSALTVLNEFPVDETPGNMPGRIQIFFSVGEEGRYMYFTETEASEALASGLTGAALLEALGYE